MAALLLSASRRQNGGLRRHRLGLCLGLILGSIISPAMADDIQFNTEVLDVKDRANIDLGQFSRKGYIMPGTYPLMLRINTTELQEQSVSYYAPEGEPQGSVLCLTPAQVGLIGLKPEFLDKARWVRNGECLDVKSLSGVTTRGDLSTGTLYVTVPQAMLEYTAENWDPPSRWDDGIPGVLFDYSLNAQNNRQQRSGRNGYNLSGNGTAGANLGAWRFRADWQARLDHESGNNDASTRSWDWSRYYAYRAIPRWHARLTLGEDYLSSDIYDGFRFSGVSLATDDNMLPPNLRGYAPEVTGVARTNAKVVVSQLGRVLYETQVAPGPFRIQDLNEAVSGALDVRVEEQDGSVQNFSVNTASIPYLTRPGMVRYKLAAGRPSDYGRHINGPMFTTGEFSWGVDNGWSLYGGGIGADGYQAMTVGIGRDLMMLGALSFDVTQARATLPQESNTLQGGSYRLSYSKRFEELDSQVTFAGYRFSERDYLSMGEYLDARHSGDRVNSSKELYTLSFNKQFSDLGLSAYMNYSHQTYWNRAAQDNVSLSLSQYFDVGEWKNISLSLSAYRNQSNNTRDDGMYLSLSVPWGNGATVSYNAALNRSDTTQNVGYYQRLNDGDIAQVSAGASRRGGNVSSYYQHNGDLAQLTANASYRSGEYSSVGLSAEGGVTVTPEGGALHRSGILGGTRLLVDTGGVADVPVRGYGSAVHSNRFGKAVVADINSYYRNSASIDVDKLADNAEVTRSVVQATLTEGAIGYRGFDVIAGAKAMAVIRLADGSVPPFGATVLNQRKQETGIVSDDGSVYLSGITPGDTMNVRWDGRVQCQIRLPAALPSPTQPNLLLPCERIAAGLPTE